jgi:ubiquinone/menaquinone biosynthesis C-methylase UbiE
LSSPRSANERYHDRIAPKYDEIYDSVYWRFYREISWRHLVRFLPAARPARAADIGCGTGWFGIRLMKAGFSTLFVDLSRGMLEAADARIEREGVKGEYELYKRDVQDLHGIDDQALQVVTLQGDPLSFCERPERAVAELSRVLQTGGVAVVSVDHMAAGPAPLLQRKDFAGLDLLLRRGETEWLADQKEERFPMRMFDADGLEKMFRSAGLVPQSLIGKTCLVQRQHEELLADRALHLRLLDLEESVHGRKSFLGLAHHIQLVAKKA